jgi:hypothetical protein
MATPIQDGVFSNLPVELNTWILRYLSAGELLSAIEASPRLANVFMGNREYILRLHMQNFYEHFGQIDAVPLIQFLSELRSIRQQHKAEADIEKQVEPILDDMLALELHKDVERPEKWRLNLSTLSKAEILIPEMRETFTYHNEEVRQRPKPKWLTLDQLPERLTWMFARTYLRFECSFSIFGCLEASSLGSRRQDAGYLCFYSPLDVTDDPDVIRSSLWSFCPSKCLELKYEQLFDEVSHRLWDERGPFKDRETYEWFRVYEYKYELSYLLASQGYPQYLYVKGLASAGDWELEKYLAGMIPFIESWRDCARG